MMISFFTMLNISARSLFLEASWNPIGQQNLGLAAAIDPALKVLYKSEQDLQAARLRNLDFFNTNPISSGLAIGFKLKMEEMAAQGLCNPESNKRLCEALDQSLASLGDAFFWQSWLPLCSLMGVWFALSMHVWWGPLIVPIMFCLLAIPVRFGGLFVGYHRGEAVFDLLNKYKINHLAHYLKLSVAVLVGVSTVILVSLTNRQVLDATCRPALWLIIVSALLAVLGMRFLTSKLPLLINWYPALLVSMAAFIAVIFV